MDDVTTLLFDIDGTVLNTDEFILHATEHALATVGYPVPDRSVISKTIGIPFPEYYVILSGASNKIDALIEAHRNFQYKNYNLVKLFPNSLATLKSLKHKGYKMAAVTSRSNKTSIQTIDDAGLLDVFDIIISFEDTHTRKPDPAPLFKALQYFKEVPKKAVMIGDSHLDIQAGKNAGTKTIRAVYGFHTENLHDPEPDFIIKDISELLTLLP